MKRFLMAMVCLMTMVLSVNAQSGWVSVAQEEDELMGQEAYTGFIYSNEVGSVVLWDNDDKTFRIISNDGVFDSFVGQNGWSMKTRSMVAAVVGYYDTNDKLIEKKKCYFEIGVNHKEANSIRFEMHRVEGKYVISYLRNKKGYVRIIAPLYSTHQKFDIKVPCMKN